MKLFIIIMLSLLIIGCGYRTVPKEKPLSFANIEDYLISKDYILQDSDFHKTINADVDLKFNKIESVETKVYTPKYIANYLEKKKKEIEIKKKIPLSEIEKNTITVITKIFETKQKCIDSLTLEKNDWCNLKKQWNTCKEYPNTIIITEKTADGFIKAFYCNNATQIEVFGYNKELINRAIK